MSADLLRRAAALMRERAGKATPGPWRVCAEGSEGSRIAPDCPDKRERTRLIGIANGRVQPEDGWNAEHIAGMDPAVTLAVADLLDAAAVRAEAKVARGGLSSAVWSHEIRALTVARAYLGSDA